MHVFLQITVQITRFFSVEENYQVPLLIPAKDKHGQFHGSLLVKIKGIYLFRKLRLAASELTEKW